MPEGREHDAQRDTHAFDFARPYRPLMCSPTEPAVWRNYLAWQVVYATAKLLSEPFVNEAFSMRQVLFGLKACQTEIRPMAHHFIDAPPTAAMVRHGARRDEASLPARCIRRMTQQCVVQGPRQGKP